MAFNENSRVKLPALVHLCKLGYDYISEKKLRLVCDPDTNINVEVFRNKLRQFNPLLKPIEIDQFFDKLKITLDNDELGREFYQIVSANSGISLTDFTFATGCLLMNGQVTVGEKEKAVYKAEEELGMAAEPEGKIKL